MRDNPLIECACGCGQLRPKYNDKREIRRFIHGHNRRDNYRSADDNGLVACQCGCGAIFLKYTDRGKMREFLPGHYIRRIMTLEEKFSRHVEKTNSCWTWKGYQLPRGYGMLNHEGKHILAHRASYELYNGPIMNNLWVLHRCDNPSCVNPDHLFLGTPFDNTRDAINKGRIKGRSLTNEEVVIMKSLFVTEGYSQAELARMFGASSSAVNDIVRNIRRATPAQNQEAAA